MNILKRIQLNCLGYDVASRRKEYESVRLHGTLNMCRVIGHTVTFCAIILDTYDQVLVGSKGGQASSVDDCFTPDAALSLVHLSTRRELTGESSARVGGSNEGG